MTERPTAVLVFGADRERRQGAGRAISALGYRVRLASTRAEAAKAIAAGDVRLVLLCERVDATNEHELSRAFGVPTVVLGGADPEGAAELVRAAISTPDVPAIQAGERE